MARAELTVNLADLDEVKALIAELVAERDAARAALTRVREWAEGDYGGTKRPIDVWPGLRAALAVPEPGGHCGSCHRPLPHNPTEQRACGGEQ